MIVKIEQAKYGGVLKATDVFGNVYYGSTLSEHTRRALGHDEPEGTSWQTARGFIVDGRVLEALRTAHALYVTGDGDVWNHAFAGMFKERDDAED